MIHLNRHPDCLRGFGMVGEGVEIWPLPLASRGLTLRIALPRIRVKKDGTDRQTDRQTDGCGQRDNLQGGAKNDHSLLLVKKTASISKDSAATSLTLARRPTG